MRAQRQTAENRERRTNSMGKKFLIVLLVAVVFFAAGFWFYRFYETRRPIPSVAPGTGDRLPARPPVGGTAAGGSVGGGTAVNKGTNAEPPEFTPRTGEVLDFAANVTKLSSTVATLQVKVGNRRSLDGKDTWHLQAFAHTQNPYRMVFELDDQFDSYSETPSFASLQYELHLSERGQKVDTVEKMVTSNKTPAPANAVAARVLPGTRDPIGLLMYLRSVDWNKTSEVRSPVFDGHTLYDVRAVLVGRNQLVSVTAGKYATTKIEIHVLDNGTEMKDAHFLLYLAQDPERLPVLLEAVLPVATARVELTKVH
jgi:Protein of unknown function (DUF3108)